MDKLKAMHVFIQIAERGSLTAAAQALPASLPAVVRTLAMLEAHLGVRLLQRTTRRLSLTEEGRRYLEDCRQVLAAVEQAEAALSTDAAHPSGLITVTAPVFFGQMHVAPAVTRFVQHYDKMRVKVVLLDRVVNLLEEGFDAGIRIGELDDSSLVAQRLCALRRVVVASPDYLRRHGVPQHPRELLGANCVLFSGASGPWWTFQEAGRQFTVPVSGNLEFNQAAPAADACAEGLGMGMFISYQVMQHVKAGRLQLVLEQFEPAPRPVHVVYPHARLLPARTRAFVDWMKQSFDGFAA